LQSIRPSDGIADVGEDLIPPLQDKHIAERPTLDRTSARIRVAEIGLSRVGVKSM